MSQYFSYYYRQVIHDAEVKTASIDLLGSKTFHGQIVVDGAGSAGSAVWQHSNIDEDPFFKDTGSAKALNSTGNQDDAIDNVMRYVRLHISSAAGNPTVSIAAIVR